MNRKPQEATGEITEEVDYVNTSVSTVIKTASTSDQKSPSFTQSFLPIAVCWAILLLIMSLRIYFTSVMSENNGRLTAEVQQLKTQMEQLNNLTEQTDSNVTSLMSQITHLETQNQQLETQNQELETQNQQLKGQKKNLTARIQDMETQWNEQNISRALWSVDLYCPITNGERKCKPCLDKWTPKPPNCYTVNDAPPADQRTWDRAREDCKGKNSDLAVIANEQEKTSVGDVVWSYIRNNEFWIGLRAEDGKWKWLDGSELTDNSWIQQPPADGQCAAFLKNSVWKSVNCNEKKQWICQQKALTLT